MNGLFSKLFLFLIILNLNSINGIRKYTKKDVLKLRLVTIKKKKQKFLTNNKKIPEKKFDQCLSMHTMDI